MTPGPKFDDSQRRLIWHHAAMSRLLLFVPLCLLLAACGNPRANPQANNTPPDNSGPDGTGPNERPAIKLRPGSAAGDRFRTVWHEDGVMMATWFQGSRDEFIRVSREGWDKGVNILHFLGGHSADIAGPRAVSQTKMTISQRAIVEGVACDVVCTGRFYDFLEKRDGRWGMVLRQPIYEKDRIDAIDPMAELRLDPELLAQFPEGYRHLAYLQTRIGYKVLEDGRKVRVAKRSGEVIDV